MSDAALSIAFMSPAWPPGEAPSGIVTYVATLLPAMRSQGHRVSILAAELAAGQESPAVEGADRARARRSLPERLCDGLWYRAAPASAIRHQARRAVVQAARALVARGEVQLLEMEESFGWSRWVARAAGVPVCVRLHGPWFLAGAAAGGAAGRDAGFRRRVADEGRALAEAALVTAPAHDVLARTRAHYGLALDGAEVIPNPIQAAPAGERWTLADCDRRLVLFIGRFDRLKGGDLIVEAFRAVLERVPDARLCLVGPDRGFTDGDGRSWSLPAFLESRLPGARAAGQVDWRGPLPFGALAALRRRALVSVVCSRYENFPYAATEAMALGAPLVAARIGGIPEIVEDEVDGLLHRPGDAGDLADRIVELLRAPERAAALGRRAAADCERLLDPGAIAARLTAAYRRALARNRARR